MKFSKASEEEIDERLRLDKRKDSNAFCRYFDRDESLPSGFYELQDKVRHGLERVFWANFDDGIDRSEMPAWKTPMNEHFFFPAELLISERVIIELSGAILCDKLVAVVLSYLGRHAPQYCVIAAVYDDQVKGDNYVGRFVVTRDGVVGEDSLVRMWSQKVEQPEDWM